MSVTIASARIDENGKISGGMPGDQGGKEVSEQAWYRHTKGWVLLRCVDPAKAKLIAQAAKAAADNQKIGYDQSGRNTLYNAVKPMGFDPAKVTTPVETDCSALVRVCCAFAGIVLPDFNTSTEAATLEKSGQFIKLTEAMYTASPDYLLTGDILVTKTKGHTVVVLNDGPKAVITPTPPVNPSGNTATVTGGSVNMRVGPGKNCRVITVVHKGDVVTITGDEDGGWWTVRIKDGRAGWISGTYLKL